MESFFYNLTPFAVGAVILVLLLGLWNLLRRGPGRRSQILMRWRIGLQLLAICIVMAAIYFAS